MAFAKTARIFWVALAKQAASGRPGPRFFFRVKSGATAITVRPRVTTAHHPASNVLALLMDGCQRPAIVVLKTH